MLDFEQFGLPKNGVVGLVGHNGAGKSTLLRLLALLEAPTEGQVLWNGTAVSQRARTALRRRVTLVEQRPILLRGTVRDNLAYGLELRELGRTAVNGIIGEVVEKLGLAPLLGRRRNELSDGEIQRVAVARALVLRTEVLLLDEPTSSDDRAAASALYRTLAAEVSSRCASRLTSSKMRTAWPTISARSRTAGCRRSHRRTCFEWSCPPARA